MANEILKRDQNNQPVIGLVTDDTAQEIRMGRIDDTTKGLKVMVVGGSGAGTVTSISQGTGMSFSANPITTTGTISLANTAVTPGSYTLASITVDAQGRITSASNGSAPGVGTVTSVSVVTANGISGSVATATTTPAITLSLGNIAPTTVNGLTITTSTGTLSIVNGKTLTINKSIQFTSADDTGNYTLPTGTKTLVDTTVATLSSLTTIGTLTNLTVTNAPTFSAMTAGSVPFAGTAGLLSQDNTNLFWDNTNKQLSIGGKGGVSFANSQFPLTNTGTVNDYLAYQIQNLSSGDSAATDIVASADNDSRILVGHYIDMGIDGSGYSPVAAGNVATVSVNTAGSGYSVNDILTISTGGDGNAQVQVLTLGVGGAVATITLYDPGTGYVIGSGYTTTGGTGIGCKVNVLSIVDFTLSGANDGYLYVSGGNLIINTDTLNSVIKFAVQGGGTSNEVGRFTTTGLTIGLAGTTKGILQLSGNTSGTTSLQPASAASGTLTLPSATDTVAVLAASQAFTNKTYNGLTITSSTGTLTITNGKTLTVSNSITLAGTDGKGINVGAATAGKILIGDGSNMVLSTPTYPTSAGASGNVLTSDGANWTSTAPAGATITYKNGTTIRAGDTASGAQNINHGLGKTPKFAHFSVKKTSGAGTQQNLSLSDGSYNGTSNSCSLSQSQQGAGGGSGSVSDVDGGSAIFIIDGGGAGQQSAVVTWDAINLILTWTKSGSPSSDSINIEWWVTA